MTDVEKVRAVNDYIVANTSYTDQTNSSPHSAYTVLAEHGGVCQGYALLAHPCFKNWVLKQNISWVM